MHKCCNIGQTIAIFGNRTKTANKLTAPETTRKTATTKKKRPQNRKHWKLPERFVPFSNGTKKLLNPFNCLLFFMRSLFISANHQACSDCSFFFSISRSLFFLSVLLLLVAAGSRCGAAQNYANAMILSRTSTEEMYQTSANSLLYFLSFVRYRIYATFLWLFEYFMCSCVLLLRLFPFSYALTMIYGQTIVTKFVFLHFVWSVFFYFGFLLFVSIWWVEKEATNKHQKGRPISAANKVMMAEMKERDEQKMFTNTNQFEAHAFICLIRKIHHRIIVNVYYTLMD